MCLLTNLPRASNQYICDIQGINNAQAPYNSQFQINANSVESISCQNGYVINGNNYIQCRPDGTNTAVPTCEIPITCTVSINNASNGHHQQFTMDAATTVNISCDSGYSITGNPNINCDGSGHLPSQLM